MINNKEEKMKPKRLIIDVPASFHKLIKSKANDLGISIRSYIIRALIEKHEREI